MAAKSKSWIAGAIGKPGSLHAALHVPPGQKLTKKNYEEAEAAGGKEAAEARLAQTLQGFHGKGSQAKDVKKAVKRGSKAKAKAKAPAEAKGGSANPPVGSAAWREKFGK